MKYFENFETFNENYEQLSQNMEWTLKNKAESFKQQGITFAMLRKIYSRGIEAWQDNKKGNAKTFAMNRVNNFLSKGKAGSVFDSDQAAKARKHAKKLKKKKK